MGSLRWVRVVLGVLFVLTGWTAPSFATQKTGPALGWVYLSAAPDGYDRRLSATEFLPFRAYVVAEIDYSDVGLPQWNLSNGIVAWEAAASIPASMVLTGLEIHPAEARNSGSLDNWIVELGQGASAASSPVRLATLHLLVTTSPAPADAELFLKPSTPSVLDPAAPAFRDALATGECLNALGNEIPCWRSFARVSGAVVNCVTKCWEDDCFLANCSPVAEEAHWGALKARFGS